MKKTFKWLFVFLFMMSCSVQDIEMTEKERSLNDDELVDEGNLLESDKDVIELTDQEQTVLTAMSRESVKLSPEEVMDMALSVFDDAYGNKSLNVRRVASCLPLISKGYLTSNLKSAYEESDDTLAYIVNFEDSLGYVVLAADVRAGCDVLAYNEVGTFNEENDNPGVGLFMEQAEDYIRASIEDYEITKDSILADLYEKLEMGTGGNKALRQPTVSSKDVVIITTDVICGNWKTIKRVAPLSVVEWGQSKPFNQHIDFYCDEKGQPAPVGCVALATAQIMAKWKYPSRIGNFYFDWNEMVRYTAKYSFEHRKDYLTNNMWRTYASEKNMSLTSVSNIGRLLQVIGEKIGIKYGCDGSSGYTSKAIALMKSLGYSSDNVAPYTFSAVKASIDNGSIVMAEGFSDKSGHAWNYDGYLQKKRDVRTTIYTLIESKKGISRETKTVTSCEYSDYVHINWGWSGIDNGYYLSNVFDTKNGPELNSDDTWNTTGSAFSDRSYYNRSLKIYTNIKK
ncbi:MAG: C10 family peptidase [Bacteroidales bacterium]|nr:C10 family peptidase [Bacteroidales bacterium]